MAACLLLIAPSCTVPLVEDLSEGDAADIIVTLSGNDIGASKERDPEREGRYRVAVATDDVSLALATLHNAGLPPRSGPGVLESLGDSTLIPSRTNEKARWLAGTAGELERSLLEVGGVLSARVHLAVPEKNSFTEEEQQSKPSASVLLRYRGASPPLGAPDIQHLVSGAVGGLTPEHVAVVLLSVPDASIDAERRLSQLGPLSVTRSSAHSLRLLLGSAAAVNLLLVGCLLWLWARVRRSRQAKAPLDAPESSP